MRRAGPARPRAALPHDVRKGLPSPGVSTSHTPFPGRSGSHFVPLYQLLMSLRDTHEAMKAFGVGAGFKPRAVQISFGPANRLLILLNKLRP